MRSLLDRLEDASARFEQVICIAGAITEDTITDPLRDFLDDCDDRLIECFGEAIQPLLDEGSLDDVFGEWAIDNNRLGFLICVATPIMEHFEDGVSQGSWGYYATSWVYGDTFDEAVQNAFHFVESRRERERQKGGDK